MFRIVSLLGLLWAGQLSAQTGKIMGTVRDAVSKETIPFATVQVLKTDKGAVSDENGVFVIEGIKPDIYDLKASVVGYAEQIQAEVQVTTARPVEVNFDLTENSNELKEVVVKAAPFVKTDESPVSLRNIGVTEIQRNPGGNRDISAVIRVLPGVLATPAFRNDLIIRGGAPNENRFFYVEVEVPNINHFATQGASGGPVGMINVNFIREVDFFSGAFPANRGNAMSSVLNFKLRDGRNDRIGGNFTLGATDVGALLEGPIGKKTTFMASYRRSYLQFLFQALGLPFLPIYQDFQFKVKIKPTENSEITLLGLGAIDDFALNLEANETETQQYILAYLPDYQQWNYMNGIVYKRYQDNGYWTFVASRNMLNNVSKKYVNNDDSTEDNLVLDYLSREAENKLRAEHTFKKGKYRVMYGAGYEYVRYTNTTFNKIFTAVGPQTINFSTDINFHKYYAFGNLSRKFIEDKLTFSLGARVDGNSYSSEMNNPLRQFSPRFSVNYLVNERLGVNFNAGRYYQLPPYTILGYQEGGKFVNKDNGARFIQNDQAVAGIEYNTRSSSRFTVETYFKKWNYYPFLTQDSISLANLGGGFGVVGNAPATPTSVGRSYGVEFMFQQRLFKGFYGIAAYTFGFSEFKDKKGEYRPTAWDSRHQLNTTLGKKFGKNWEAGINWRIQTGLPYTPDDEDSNLVLNWQRNGRAVPDYDLLNSQRTGILNTIDVRVDKKWFFKKWSLNLYLDVDNLTAQAVSFPIQILDRPLDDNMQPVGGPVVINPDATFEEQRYALKSVQDAVGTRVPSVGILLEF